MTLYSKNQLVWAKIKGYPWWPAIVAQSNQKKSGAIEDEVLVNFIGDNSHAFIALDKIADFAEEFDQYQSNKNKKLQESIKAAQRIQVKETTYEEERLRFLKKDKRQKSEDSSTPARSTVPDKDENEKKDVDRKTSPKTKNPVKVQKEKEKKVVDEEIDDLKDFLPRFTRSVSKKENIEMLTEPLIYNSRKNQKSTSRGRRKSALKDQRNKGKKLVRLEKTAHSSSSLQEKAKLKAKRDKQRLITRTGFYKKESVGKSDEMEIEHEESEEGERKGSKKRDYELDEILNDVDEDCESFDLNIETCLEMEPENPVKKSFGAVNKKRKLKIDDDEDDPASFYITQGNDNDTKSTTDETECITKKVKMSAACERESDNLTPLANQGVQILSESDKRRIQLESELEKVLSKFSGRFQKQGEAPLADESIAQLLQMIKEFENNNFEGSELVHSKLGKVFKTIQFMLIKNKSSLSKIEEAVLVPLANVIHKIKLKIIEFSFDNTDYLTSFNLNEELGDKTQKIAFAPINVDPLLVKMEESHNQQAQALKNAERKESTKMKIEEHVNGTGHHQVLPIKMQEQIALKNEHFGHHEMIHQNNNHHHHLHKMNGEPHKTVMQEQKQAPVVSETVQLRKKICRKFASLLQKVYSMEKNKSQSLTLAIEDKINNFYANSINEYKQSIKRLLKIIKGNQLEVEELIQTQMMGIHDFNNLLKSRLSLVVNSSESPENDEAVAPRAHPHEIKIQYHNKIEFNGQNFAQALRPLLPSQNK